MKKLALGAVLAATTLGACASSSSEAVIDAEWTFETVSGGQAPSCPPGFDTTAIIALPWTPFDDDVGTAIVDLFDCDDFAGVTDPVDGLFRVFVQVQAGDNANDVFARSRDIVWDTLDGDLIVDFPILADGGYFGLSWELRDAVSNQRLSCSDADADDVEVVATISGTTDFATEQFDCDDGYGTSDPLLADTYTVSVNASNADGAVGTADTLVDEDIFVGEVTDLGHIVIPID